MNAVSNFAYANLVRNAIRRGYTVSVFDGEEWAVKRSQDVKAIFNAIQSVEEAEILVRDAAGQKIGRATILPYGVEPEETVADHTTGAEMRKLVNAS